MTDSLPIVDDDGGLMLLAPLITLGVMYFPDGEELDAFVTALGADSLIHNLANDEETNSAFIASNPDAQRRLWKILLRNKEAEGLLQEAAKSAPQARLAADVLTTALQLGAHMPRLASVNNAVRIVCKAQGLSRSRVLADWAHFKPVSHLWAAAFDFLLLAEHVKEGLVTEALEQYMPEDLPPDIDRDDLRQVASGVLEDDEFADMFLFCSGDNLLPFLSIAEAFRRRAERQQVPGSRTPLFGQGEVVAVPAVLNVGPAALKFPPLDSWMIDELGAS